MSIFAVYINILTVNDNASARLTVAHRYALGYQMGCNDDPYQENYIGIGVIHGHSHDFTRWYNQPFFYGCTHYDPALQKEVDTIIARHLHVNIFFLFYINYIFNYL